jgi:hypothetical protein
MTVHVFGVRHHGPGSARSVAAALRDLAPDIVLVEGPPEADAVLGLVAHPQMTPPVALLGYAVGAPERAVFHPFAVFSPEWQAMAHANATGIAVRMCDLPLAHVLADQGDPRRLGDDEAAIDPIATLAHAAGYDDPERWWEDVVEHRDEGPFAAIADAMAAVRSALPARMGDGADREERREAAMRQAVRRAGADGYERVAVVCGAWHVPALDRAGSATTDARLLRGLPRVKVAVTWVPWTHARLAATSGYGAGVASPGWYHHLFVHAGPDVVARWFAEAARVLRDADRAVSPDHVIEATRLADALATVRGRPLAGLDEVNDAARAVMGDGGDAPMVLLRERLVVGDQLGEVPDETPMVPLARDLVAQQRRVRLKPESAERLLELDLRRDRDRERSWLLHRLAGLGVPWGVLDEGRGSSGTFRESWSLQWVPELSVLLVDASALGTTVQAAATAKVRESARRSSSIGELTLAVEACLLGALPEALAEVMDALAARAAVDVDIVHLMDALGPLARALRYGDVRGTDAGSLTAVVDGLVVRIAAGLGLAAASLDDEAAAAFAQRLAAVQGAVALLDQPRHRQSWYGALGALVTRQHVHGLVRGRACRVLLDAEVLDTDEAGRHLSQALSVGTPAAEGAAFVEGFLAGSGTILVHDRRLLTLLDDWMASLADDAFTDVLPLLRRTFGSFDASERRLVGELVRRGEQAGAAQAGVGDLDEPRVLAVLAALRELLGPLR